MMTRALSFFGGVVIEIKKIRIYFLYDQFLIFLILMQIKATLKV